MTEQFDENIKGMLAGLALGAGAAMGGDSEPSDNNKPGIEQSSEKPQLVKGKLNVEYHIINKLMAKGLTHIAAIGVVANLKAESKLDPTTKQIARYKPLRYGPGRGLAQWEMGGRFDTDRINLVDFAERRGTDWTDLDTQIDFILHEMTVHPEYKRVLILLNNAESVEEATKIFLTKYEKAGIPHMGNRLEFARYLKDKYNIK